MLDENNNTSKIISSAAFKKLLKVRSIVRFSLALMVLVCHAFFVGGIAFYNQWFGESIHENSAITNGIICTVVIIVVMLLLELLYIILSQKVLDPLQMKAAKEVGLDV